MLPICHTHASEISSETSDTATKGIPRAVGTGRVEHTTNGERRNLLVIDEYVPAALLSGVYRCCRRPLGRNASLIFSPASFRSAVR
jgi:hypothetical protein